MVALIVIVVAIVLIMSLRKSDSKEMDLDSFAREYVDKYRSAAKRIQSTKYDNNGKLISDMADANDEILDAAYFLNVHKTNNMKKKGDAYVVLRNCVNEYNWIYKGTKYPQCYGMLMEDAIHKVYFND